MDGGLVSWWSFLDLSFALREVVCLFWLWWLSVTYCDHSFECGTVYYSLLTYRTLATYVSRDACDQQKLPGSCVCANNQDSPGGCAILIRDWTICQTDSFSCLWSHAFSTMLCGRAHGRIRACLCGHCLSISLVMLAPKNPRENHDLPLKMKKNCATLDA